jgi:hypothetical protein
MRGRTLFGRTPRSGSDESGERTVLRPRARSTMNPDVRSRKMAAI